MRVNPACAAWLLGLCVVVSFVPSALSKDQPPKLSPSELVRSAVENEINASRGSGPHFIFKDEKKTPHLSETKLMVETRDATAGLLVMQDGHPLSPDQRAAEVARLQAYIQNPQELRKKRKQEKEDDERTERIVKALPDAFLYQEAGTEQGTDSVGEPGAPLVRLNFRPNPNYSPPSHVEQVLTGMQGNLLIDAKEKRIAEINGTLQKEVGFGWGILGHLDPGGRFLVQQADVGSKQWEVTHMELSFTGKVLFFKKLNIRDSETFSEFRPVPANLTFAQGVELLKKQAAGNQSAVATPEGNRRETKTRETAQSRKKDDTICCDH